MKIENVNKKGHWEVQFEDGLVGVGFYEKTLNDVITILAHSAESTHRVVKSIEFVED